MIGMDRNTGTALADNAHLAQSITDILSTPIGTRVQRRDYGSMVPEFIGRAGNPVNRALVFAATALAIKRWEPRIRLTSVNFSKGFAEGRPEIIISGERTDLPPANAHVSYSIPIRISGSATTSAS
jgi:uncharacterized protein